MTVRDFDSRQEELFRALEREPHSDVRRMIACELGELWAQQALDEISRKLRRIA